MEGKRGVGTVMHSLIWSEVVLEQASSWLAESEPVVKVLLSNLSLNRGVFLGLAGAVGVWLIILNAGSTFDLIKSSASAMAVQ